eukprot:8302953-Pyramimonas_sp.AAC.1
MAWPESMTSSLSGSPGLVRHVSWSQPAYCFLDRWAALAAARPARASVVARSSRTSFSSSCWKLATRRVQELTLGVDRNGSVLDEPGDVANEEEVLLVPDRGEAFV